MPLTIANNLTSFKNKKRTHLITDEPFHLGGGIGVWDDNTSNMNVTYSPTGNTYLILQSSNTNAYAGVEYPCTPYSTYKFTGELLVTIGGTGGGKVKFGTSAGSNAMDEGVVARSGSAVTVTKDFNVGNRTTFWLSFYITNTGVYQYWDEIKIEETG